MKKKIFFYMLQVLFFTLPVTKASYAETTDDKTEIIIIGTVHKSTHNFDSDSLLNILNSVNPEVILVECDSSYMTPDFKLKNDIKYSFPETSAITEYSKTKLVELRPYDITGRDNFLNDNQRRRNERSFFNDISWLSKEGKLSTQATRILNKVLSIMNVAEEMANEKITYINNREGSMKIDTINYYSYVGLSKLIDFTPELSVYKNYWDAEYGYWQKRNDVMLENILSYQKLFEGKKMVVFCGFSHKNILKKGLISKGNQNIVVKEFWEDDLNK